MTRDPGPTPPSDRITSLDALRGFALLGILVINIRVFSMPEQTLLNPTVYGDFTGLDYWTWFLGHVFAQAKFITLFSALFGAGVLLFVESKEEKGQDAARLHLRRTAVLIAIGLLHAYLLWYGDILVTYGLTGIFLLFVRDLDARRLTTLAGVFLLFVPAIELFAAVSIGGEAIAAQWQPAEAAIREQVATYRGGWLDQMSHRVSSSFQRQTSGFIGQSFWRVGGVMLLGMALYKKGVLTDERFGDDPYLAVTAATRYNELVVPSMGLAGTLTDSNGETVVESTSLEPSLDPELGFHYGAVVPGATGEETATIDVTTPPQVARHEGYETAFFETPTVELD